MPSIRHRVFFRIDQYINGVKVASFMCKRREFSSLRDTVVPNLIPENVMVTFQCFEGFHGAEQSRGVPINWKHVATLQAGSALFDHQEES